MATRYMNMTKDGVTHRVVRSAFRNVWVHRGWEAAPEDAPTDPHILNLSEAESLEDYLARRDEARGKSEEALARAEEQLRLLDEADRAEARGEAADAPVPEQVASPAAGTRAPLGSGPGNAATPAPDVTPPRQSGQSSPTS